MSELNVSGSNMTVELQENTLYAESNTGNKQWVAVITDTHPKYNYDRDFVAYQKPKTADRDSGTATIKDGAVIERVRYTHSGKNRSDTYYQLVDGEAHEIEEVDVVAALEGEIIPDVSRNPENPHDWDTEPAIMEVHECPGCGQECESQHDVAVHQGIAHTEDENEQAVTTDGGESVDDVDIEPHPADQEGRYFDAYYRGNHYFFTIFDGEVHQEQGEHLRGDGVTVDDAPSVVYGAAREWVTDRYGNIDMDDNIVTDGGLEVREFCDVEHSDNMVRSYRTPPGDRLYAYRSDDGEHHIVVSRGSEPGTRWEKRVPATRKRPIPGQKLWTIPDNWEKRIYSKRNNIAYALFYIPDSDTWAEVSVPTNDWLTDAWHGVNAVGDLDVEPVGDIGSRYDIRQLADELLESGRFHEEDAEALGEIADNWEVVVEDLRRTTEWVRDEGLDEKEHGDQPVHADCDWEIEFHQDRIFRPGEAIKHVVDLSEYEIPLSVILDELREAGLLPSYYSFTLTLEDSAIGMGYYVRGLIEAGVSPAEALDYYMVEVEGLTQTTWADERGVDQSTVSGNVSQAERKFK